MGFALVNSLNTIQGLAGRLTIAQEEERKRIACELHDDLSQQLAAIGIALSSLNRNIEAPTAAIQERFEELQNKFNSLTATVRQLASELHRVPWNPWESAPL